MAQTMPLEQRGITASRIALGCMGLGGGWQAGALAEEHYDQAERAIEAAFEAGITMFDHADIYGRGRSEQAFGEILRRRPELRERMVLQSKCGIRLADDRHAQRYDFSKAHILASVDGILERLHTDYIDILLLHRPDALMEPEEVAEALTALKASGKVRHFGVSNMHAGQIRFLQQALDMPLVANQLDMSLYHLDWLDHGVLVNRRSGEAVSFDQGLMEHCQMNNIQLQAWGPLAQGRFSGRSLEGEPEHVRATAELVARLACEKETTAEAIVLGWLMRHPARIQPVIGTTNPDRIRACADAVRQSELMTREEWYDLYNAARGVKIP